MGREGCCVCAFRGAGSRLWRHFRSDRLCCCAPCADVEEIIHYATKDKPEDLVDLYSAYVMRNLAVSGSWRAPCQPLEPL